jgi:hypothetical protein
MPSSRPSSAPGRCSAATESTVSPDGCRAARDRRRTRRVGIAVTLELLPERIDLVGLVLQFSGLGILPPLTLAVALGVDDAVDAKYGTLVGVYAGLALFLVLLSVQEAR